MDIKKLDPNNVVVIYHANCSDGFCAAWLFWFHFRDATFIPVQHGESFDVASVRGKNVFILDFSFSRPVMLELIGSAATLICLDHHKTAAAELAGLSGCLFDMDRSGAQMARDFLYGPFGFGNDCREWVVDYTADRDLWRWELPDSRAINMGIRMTGFDFEDWWTMARNGTSGVLNMARPIVEYLERRCESICKRAKHVSVVTTDGVYVIPCVNVTDRNLTSDVGGALANQHESGIGMTYFFDGESFVFSIRSRGDADVSAIAKCFGGGGHHNAAGFKRATFFELVKQ